MRARWARGSDHARHMRAALGEFSSIQRHAQRKTSLSPLKIQKSLITKPYTWWVLRASSLTDNFSIMVNIIDSNDFDFLHDVFVYINMQ